MLMYKKLNLRLQLSEKIPFNEENISNEKYQEDLVWKNNSNTYGTCGRRNKYVYKNVSHSVKYQSVIWKYHSIICNLNFKVIVGETRYPYPWRAFCRFPYRILIMIDDRPAELTSKTSI